MSATYHERQGCRDNGASDALFDSVYPEWVRQKSETFWTPVAVALRAAELLAPQANCRVLDVGSGVGKFCLVASGARPGFFTGVEQRETLVGEARKAASVLELNTEFIVGNVLSMDWGNYDGIYFYNPFGELSSGPWCQIDDTLSHSRERQRRCVDAAASKLASLSPGTRVATYFGFGGTMPESFALLVREHVGAGLLEVWEKTKGAMSGVGRSQRPKINALLGA